jgi:hypothetical protein
VYCYFWYAVSRVAEYANAAGGGGELAVGESCNKSVGLHGGGD